MAPASSHGHRLSLLAILGRPAGRPQLATAEGAPQGEVALLAFNRETSEAEGVAALIRRLNQRGAPPEEILVFMRSDHNGAFSRPIKQALDALALATLTPRPLSTCSRNRGIDECSLSFDCLSIDVIRWYG